MSIQITVRSSNGNEKTHNINGDGPIDSTPEAEEALALAPNDDDKVQVGNDTYTRQQLIDIRDRTSGTNSKSQGDKSLDFTLSGGPRMGKWGHGTGAFDVSYGSLVKDGDKADVWAKIGGKFGGGLWSDFETPGGELADSAFYAAGVNAGVGLDFNPKGGKVHIALGAEGSVSGFTSPKDTIVSLPPTCTPDKFGQGECEPNAGPTTGNAGLTGVYNPDAHNSVHGAGVVVSGALKVGVGFEVSDNARLNFSIAPTATYLADRHPFGFNGVNFGGGVTYLFGKAPEAPKPYEPVILPSTVPSTQATSDAVKALVPAGEAFSLGAPQGGWQAGDEVWLNGTQLTEPAVPTSGSGAYPIAPESLLSGQTNVIEIRRGGKTLIKYEVSVGSGSAFGVLPPRAGTITRPAPQAGVAASPLPLGDVEVTKNVPKGSVLAVFVDGNEVGTVALQPKTPGTDHTAPVTIPNGISDGDHQIGFRLRVPGQEEVRYNEKAWKIGPAVATLSSVSVVTPPTTYSNDPIKLNLTTTRATKASLTIKDTKGRSTSVTVDIPATIPAGGLIVVGQGQAKNLPVSGVCTFTITPEGGTETLVSGSVTIKGKVSGGTRVTPTPAPLGVPTLSGKKGP